MGRPKGSKNKPKEPEVYEVEAVVAQKGDKYQVRWRGFSAKDDTWEPSANLKGSENLIAEFHASKKTPAKSAAKKAEKPSAKKAEKPSAKKAEKPSAKKAEKPAAKKVEKPAPKKSETPAAKKAEKPAPKKSEPKRARSSEPAAPAAKKRKTASGPRSAWLIFCDARRAGMEAANPGRSLAVIAALLAEQWGAITASERAEYEALASAEAVEVAALPRTVGRPKGSGSGSGAAGKGAAQKDKVKRLKAKAKELKAKIASYEKEIKAAEKGRDKLAGLKEELEKANDKLSELKE